MQPTEIEKEQENELPKILPRDSDWPMVLFYLHLNFLGILGLYMVFTQVYLSTSLFALLLIFLGILGVNAGAHRLWAHHSYDASLPLKIFLMFCHTLAGQGPIYNWVQLHRQHHKHFCTELDPYNPTRGFWYAHLTNATLKPHERQKKAMEAIDMSDLESDPVVMFQKKYYYVLFVLFFALLPINAPAEYWGESLLSSFIVIGWFRYWAVLQMAYLVHSGIKIWGIEPGKTNNSDSNSMFFVDKSFWIQYHYLAPWDYQPSEFGKYGTDCTSKFIRVCAALGYAYNLKTLSSDAVRDALYESINKNKPIQECFAEIEKNTTMTAAEYLNSVKFI